MAKTKEEHLARIIFNALEEAARALAARDEAEDDSEQATCQIMELTRDYRLAREKIAELERELKNAREAHATESVQEWALRLAKEAAAMPGDTAQVRFGVTGSNLICGDIPKPATEAPAEVAEVEGPYRLSTDNSEPNVIIDEAGAWAVFVYFQGRRDEILHLLNLGVKSEGMQKRIADLERSLESEREASADIGEAFKAAKADCIETLKSYNEANVRSEAAEAREKALRELVERWHDYQTRNYGGPSMSTREILAGREPNQPADQAPEVSKP